MMNLIKECKDAATIGISGHIRPDGDCVGSTMALYLYLKKVFPEKEIHIMLEEPAEIFGCIKDFTDIDSSYMNIESEGTDCSFRFDVFFALDCDPSRLGKAENYYNQAVKKINIDHHISNSGRCGDVNYVDPETGSCSELVFNLLEEKYMDVEIAKAIYIGIIHDTGVLQYSNTKPSTLIAAAKLIGYGFDFTRIIDETFYEKTYVQTQILGRALLESILFMDGRCVVSSIDKKTMDFYHVTSKDLDGIVSKLRNIKGVDCAVFMYETDTLQFKVSLRSNEKVDVAKVAGMFGGGGHMRAAGCTLNGTFHDVVNNISEQIALQLEESI